MYWSVESWGSDYPPVNADEIITKANEMIDKYSADHPDYDERDINDYSESLWETFRQTNELDGIVAEYEE